MQYKTHIVFGLFLWVLLLKGTTSLFTISVDFFHYVSNPFWVSIACLFVIVGSLFPDIDYHKSKLGKYFFYLNYGVTHRGILHSILGIVFVGLILYFLSQYIALSLFFIMAFLIGMISHVFLDAFTKRGILPFYPLTFRLKGPFCTGKIGEFILLWLFLVGIVVIGVFW